MTELTPTIPHPATVADPDSLLVVASAIGFV